MEFMAKKILMQATWWSIFQKVNIPNNVSRILRKYTVALITVHLFDVVLYAAHCTYAANWERNGQMGIGLHL